MSRSEMEGPAGRRHCLLAGGLALCWLIGALLAPCDSAEKRTVLLVVLGAALLVTGHPRVEPWPQVTSMAVFIAFVVLYLLGRNFPLRVPMGGARELRILPVQVALGLAFLLSLLAPCVGRRFVLEGYVVSAGLLLVLVAWINGLAVGTRYPVEIQGRLAQLTRASTEASLCVFVASSLVVRLGPARAAARGLGFASLVAGTVCLLLGMLVGGMTDVV